MSGAEWAGGRVRFGRRRLLAAGVALATVAAAGGCSSGPPATRSTLLAGDPFYIAHRGGGRDWPEMTAYAYDRSAELAGLLAMEVSVCLSRDGVLVCCHDPDTLAATGVADLISANDWADLRGLTVTAADTLQPGQPRRPLSRIEDMIGHLDRFVLFAEPKTEPARQPLLELLTRANQPNRVVWKQPIDSPVFDAAKAAGFGTWGYVLNEPAHLGDRLRSFAASAAIDYLGAPLSESDAFVANVVAEARSNAKPTIGWTVATTADRDRALRLGCRGLMASDIRGLLGTRTGTPRNP